jgi:hypothetical protein
MNRWFGIAFGVLLLFTAFFVYQSFSWKKQARAMEVKNAEFIKKNDRLQKALEMTDASHEEFRKNVEAAVASQEIAGLYEFKPAYSQRFQELDLRSDGSGIFDKGNGGTVGHIQWKKLDDAQLNIDRVGRFKIENGDLIDERGNRWLHIR